MSFVFAPIIHFYLSLDKFFCFFRENWMSEYLGSLCQVDIRNPLRYVALHRITASQFIRRSLHSPWYKQVPTPCLLLFAIEAGDLLDSVKIHFRPLSYSVIAQHVLKFGIDKYLLSSPATTWGTIVLIATYPWSIRISSASSNSETLSLIMILLMNLTTTKI